MFVHVLVDTHNKQQFLVDKVSWFINCSCLPPKYPHTNNITIKIPFFSFSAAMCIASIPKNYYKCSITNWCNRYKCNPDISHTWSGHIGFGKSRFFSFNSQGGIPWLLELGSSLSSSYDSQWYNNGHSNINSSYTSHRTPNTILHSWLYVRAY